MHHRNVLFAAIIALILIFGTIVIAVPKAEATTTTINSNRTGGTIIINPGDLLIIPAPYVVNVDNLSNGGTVIVMRGATLTNDQVIDSISNGGTMIIEGTLKGVGKLTNSDRLTIDKGGYFCLGNFANTGTVENFGKIDNLTCPVTFINQSGYINFDGTLGSPSGRLVNRPGASISISGGTILNGGAITNWSEMLFSGTTITNKKPQECTSSECSEVGVISTYSYRGSSYGDGAFTMINGASLTNDKGQIFSDGDFDVLKSSKIENLNGGTITTHYFNGRSFRLGSPNFDDTGYLNNRANSIFNSLSQVILSQGQINNYGSFNNVRQHIGEGGYSSPLLKIESGGRFDNFGSTSNGGTIDNQGSFIRECGDTFSGNAITGFPAYSACTATYPITHMLDQTATTGSVTYAGRQINAEYVNATSQLIGDKIDSITLRLQKLGSPTGMAQVGIFDSNRNVKKLFGTVDVATLSTSYTDREFKLSNNELYTIVQGDRIGIKYTGGTSSNAINVMTDRNFTDAPFDTNKSYRIRYEASWILSYSEDMYMILKQTHG